MPAEAHPSRYTHVKNGALGVTGQDGRTSDAPVTILQRTQEIDGESRILQIHTDGAKMSNVLRHADRYRPRHTRRAPSRSSCKV